MKKEIKKKVLQALRAKMLKSGGDSMFGGGMGVTVKANDKKSLLEGIKKAGDIIKNREEPEFDDNEDMESELSPSEIKDKIKKLQSLLPKEN